MSKSTKTENKTRDNPIGSREFLLDPIGSHSVTHTTKEKKMAMMALRNSLDVLEDAPARILEFRS